VTLFAPFTPTLVGSLPHEDPAAAAAFIAATFPEAPGWPQLPAVSPLEGMYPQAAGGFPGVRIAPDGSPRVVLDDEAIAAADALLAGEAAVPVPGREGFAGLMALGAALGGSGGWFKGQITGPISFALGVTGEDDRSILYDPLLREVAVAHLVARGKGILQSMAELAPGRRPFLFVDEPSLSSFGSAYLPLERSEAIDLLSRVVSGLPQPVGVHCCGNTDWSLVMASGATIVNLDAWSFGEGLALYPKELASFLASGGEIAWGIVPTDREPEGLTAQDLAARLERLIDTIAKAGIDRGLLIARSLVTPACGMGTRSINGAETIARLTAETAAILRDRLGKEA
jgi:hypothetical protein